MSKLMKSLRNFWYIITGQGSDAVWSDTFKSVFEVTALHNLDPIQVIRDMNYSSNYNLSIKDFETLCSRFNEWVDQVVYPYNISAEVGASKKSVIIVIDGKGIKPRIML